MQHNQGDTVVSDSHYYFFFRIQNGPCSVGRKNRKTTRSGISIILRYCGCGICIWDIHGTMHAPSKYLHRCTCTQMPQGHMKLSIRPCHIYIQQMQENHAIKRMAIITDQRSLLHIYLLRNHDMTWLHTISWPRVVH